MKLRRRSLCVWSVLFPSAVLFASISHARPVTTTRPAPKVTVLDSGAEPRTPIRFQPSVGATQRMVILTDVSVSQTLDGEALPSSPTPTIKQVMDVHVDSVRLDGETTLTLTLVDVSLVDDDAVMDPLVRAIVDEAIEPIRNLSYTMSMTTRGVIMSVTVDIPDEVTPERSQLLDSILQSINQLSNPIPEEPIGVGATWSVDHGDIDLGIRLRSHGEFKLVAAEDSTVTIHSTATATKSDKEPSIQPGLPEGIELAIESAETTGESSMVFDLRESMPKSMNLKVVTKTISRLTIEDTEPGEALNVSRVQTDLTMKMRIDSEQAELHAQPGKPENDPR